MLRWRLLPYALLVLALLVGLLRAQEQPLEAVDARRAWSPGGLPS
jgi:hypothetical protein